MDQFDIDKTSTHGELFERARQCLLAIDGMMETRKPRITTYSFNGKGICHLRTMPHGIDFGFLKGAKFDDKLGLLHGNGKIMRVLSLEKFDEKVISFYLNLALAEQGQIA